MKDSAIRKKVSRRNRFNERNEIVSNEIASKDGSRFLFSFYFFFFFATHHLRSVFAPFDNEFQAFPLCEETSSSLVLPPPNSLGRDIA